MIIHFNFLTIYHVHSEIGFEQFFSTILFITYSRKKWLNKYERAYRVIKLQNLFYMKWRMWIMA